MSSLQDLQINEKQVEIYTTAYVNVSAYKCLRVISSFSNSGYLYIYHSNDQKTDLLTSSFLCNNKPSLHKIEVVSDFIRMCVSTMNPNELIDEINISTKGRRNVNSSLYKFMERYQPPSTVRELERDLNLETKEEKPEEKPKEKESIYKRLGLNQRNKEKRNSIGSHNCRCHILPELLLKGHILYCREQGRLETIAPPIENKNHVLCMSGRVPFWASISDLQEAEGWFK